LSRATEGQRVALSGNISFSRIASMTSGKVVAMVRAEDVRLKNLEFSQSQSGADFQLLLDWFFQYTAHGMQFEEHASQE
jgi:hypothetical protein